HVRLEANVGFKAAPMTTFPEWLEPMAATLTQERFNGAEWTFEQKFDGIRLLAFKQGTKVQLFSRNRLPQNLPPVADAILHLSPHDLILDGEITWGSKGVVYHVFDLLWLDQRDTMPLPLEERRALLDTLVLRPPLQRVVPLAEAAPWERACAEGW